MSMSAQLAYEQILYDSAVNEAKKRYGSRRKRDNLCLLPSFMHLISQANMDTWRLSNQN